MEFWNKKIGVSRAAAARQVAIINTFSEEKRLKIATDFANMGIDQTRKWIKRDNPYFSELEISLEFVRLMYYQTGSMSEEKWIFFKQVMTKKINQQWKERFKKVMKAKNWTYDDVAAMGNFKSGKVVEATISRGLPAFAKFAVRVHESQETNNASK